MAGGCFFYRELYRDLFNMGFNGLDIRWPGERLTSTPEEPLFNSSPGVGIKGLYYTNQKYKHQVKKGTQDGKCCLV